MNGNRLGVRQPLQLLGDSGQFRDRSLPASIVGADRAQLDRYVLDRGGLERDQLSMELCLAGDGCIIDVAITLLNLDARTRV